MDAVGVCSLVQIANALFEVGKAVPAKYVKAQFVLKFILQF